MLRRCLPEIPRSSQRRAPALAPTGGDSRDPYVFPVSAPAEYLWKTVRQTVFRFRRRMSACARLPMTSRLRGVVRDAFVDRCRGNTIVDLS